MTKKRDIRKHLTPPDDSELLSAIVWAIRDEKDLMYAIGLLASARVAYKECVKPFVDELEKFLKTRTVSLKDLK
jgi:hypothetical protein